jgi:hypothetical protein
VVVIGTHGVITALTATAGPITGRVDARRGLGVWFAQCIIRHA